MPKTNWQDHRDEEILSIHITGLQDAVGKIEDALNLGTVEEVDIPLAMVPAYNMSGVLEYRIYQAPVGKRNWLASSAPVVKKNGSVITTGFSIDYGGGAILLDSTALNTDTFTASFTRTNSTPAVSAGNVTQDATHRFVADTEKESWNSKLDSVADGSITDAKLSGEAGQIKQVVNNHLTDYMPHDSELNSYASGLDSKGIYTIIDFKRTDGTLYLKSTLSNVDAYGNYQTVTWNFYDVGGTNIVLTKTWSLIYDEDGSITQKVVV